MASRLSVPEEDLICPVCCDIFKDPVVLSCGHSFCKACLQRYWSDKRIKECPVCRRRSSESDPPCNLALRNLCESLSDHLTLVSAGSEALCSLHGEKFKSFCLNDQKLICWVCRDSKQHANHRFKPINEAAVDHKKDLQDALEPLKMKLGIFAKVKQSYDQMAYQIKAQAQHTERKMKEEFDTLRRLLQEEEEAKMTALREEEERKIQTMKDKIAGLSREMSNLSDTIRVTEEEMRDDISFLQNYKATVKRAQTWRTLPSPEPQLDSGALIDVAKYLDNLTFRVWDKIQQTVSYTPVILDPNTAHPKLILSEDLTSVRLGESQQLPDNPERFDHWFTVLGSEGVNSGTHSWDVEVGDSPSWQVGVAPESVQRKGDRRGGYWRIGFYNGQYRASSPKRPGVRLPVKRKLRRVRVQLDWDRGTLEFLDPDSKQILHTFTHTFTETLFPCIFIGRSSAPLRVLPWNVSTRVGHGDEDEARSGDEDCCYGDYDDNDCSSHDKGDDNYDYNFHGGDEDDLDQQWRDYRGDEDDYDQQWRDYRGDDSD